MPTMITSKAGASPKQLAARLKEVNMPNDIKALYDLAEDVLMDWLGLESPADSRKQKALELLAEAGQLLHSACINLDVIKG